MPDCEYCGSSFDDPEAYRDHLENAHADELGRIDGRRVDDHLDGDESNASRNDGV